VVEGSLQDRIADVFVGSGNHPGRGADNNKQDLTGVDDFEGGGWLGSWKRAWGSGFGFNRDAWNWQEENRRRLEDGRPLINRDGTERPGTANLKYPERNVIAQELTDEQFNALSPAEQQAYLEARGAGGRGRSRGGVGMLGVGEVPGDPGLMNSPVLPTGPGGLEGQLQGQLESGTNLEYNGLSWDGLVETWDTTLFPALDTAKEKVVELGGAFTDYIGDKASSAWSGLRDGVVSGWNEHIMPAWNTLRTEGLVGLADDFLAKITNGAVTSWGELPSKIGEGAKQILEQYFPGLSSGLETLRENFGTIAGRIGEVWDGLKDKLASVVDWLIDTVYNNGIVSFWNAIAGKIGLGTLEPIPGIGSSAGKGGGTGKIKAYADGGVHGVMSGYSPGIDDRFIAVGGGEAIMRPEWTRAVGPDYVDAANQAARAGGVDGVRKFLGAYADGGIVMDGVQITTVVQQSMWDKIREAFPDVFLTSATRTQDVGSGFDFHMGGKAIDLDGPNNCSGIRGRTSTRDVRPVRLEVTPITCTGRWTPRSGTSIRRCWTSSDR
jgi:hypothetical protein